VNVATMSNEVEQNSLDRPCNLCQSREFDVLSTTGRDGEYLRTVICKQCGLVWSDPFPIDPKQFYEKDYWIGNKGAYKPKAKNIYRAAKVAMDRYRKINQHLAGKKSVLDIGSGGGEFAYLLSRKGFNVHGIEPNEGYGKYAQDEYGLDVEIGFTKDIDFKGREFDFITMWHVLEHTEDPYAVICKIYDWVSDNGLLVVEVPNVEAVCQSPKNTFHADHLFNFNLKTLSLLMEKAGFATIDSIVSSDGGNITVIAKKSTRSVEPESLVLAGNYDKIFNIVTKRSNLTHFLSVNPYSRLIKKIPKIILEAKASTEFTNGKQILDSCYKEEIENM
jgi:2-polyprenyl-3-methyl-5-hydroxy-6-metoxy-1,4-benzoquinol methylase